ncbi:hypothetical protein JG688_00001017 [Phytophthora aleatoria]|uniref:Uncharacterized protein n=1 Tax=Phytophthora aleatoria TaxID=2496075 RepID=A0A8J5J4Y7_9STRA|nr:hypothetical protein JG688_00001017 [Phytophthora aleatoria]
MTNWRRKEELDLIAACGRVVSAHPQEVLAKPSEALKSELYKAFKAFSCSERRTQRSTIIKCHQLFKRFVTMQASTSHPIEITGKSLREAKRKRSIRAPLKKGATRVLELLMDQKLDSYCQCETMMGMRTWLLIVVAKENVHHMPTQLHRLHLVSNQSKIGEPTEQRMAGVEGDVEELPMLERAEREDGVPLVQRIVEMASNTVEDINSFIMDLLRKHWKVMNKVLVRDASAAILEGESDVAAQFERLFQKQATDAKELAQMMHAQMNASIYMA